MTKIAEASKQLVVLNEKLAVQKVRVAEKTEACEKLLAEISHSSVEANSKKELAVVKAGEIQEQSAVIAVEKVR